MHSSKSEEPTRSVATIPPDLRPTDEEIAARAYDLYRRRGAADGHDQDDWLRAEADLIEERRHRFVTV